MSYDKAVDEEMASIWDQYGDGYLPSERQFEQLRREAEENISNSEEGNPLLSTY